MNVLLNAFGKPAYSTKQVTMYDASGRILYAVDVLVQGRPGVWRHKDPMVPVFAWDAHDAKKQAAEILGRQIERFRILGAGPAIGFFAHDDHGDKLSFSPRDKTLHEARIIRAA